jgi:hypothetical protein
MRLPAENQGFRPLNRDPLTRVSGGVAAEYPQSARRGSRRQSRADLSSKFAFSRLYGGLLERRR